MALTPGLRLGPYEILIAIGAGGMGEVYRARDTKLNRDVAIKILPPAFSQDAERLRRFEREAQVLAALNHPNIAAIYGLEVGTGSPALVMELVEGETLSGPKPVEEAIAIARQIAEALEYAHEKGIIHRDLKPANIKITPDGKVKVLDFGLAKALVDDTSSSDYSNSPTLSLAATKMGVILGTAAYMSPEQARGKAVDRRTDIWAFGAVLYEMLTGKRAFPGETASDSIAGILAKDVDWSALPPGSPVKLLCKCLEKDPARRLRHIGDAFHIEEAAAPPVGSAVGALAPPSRSWPLPLLACVLVCAVAAGSVVLYLKRAATTPTVSRLVITLGPGERLGGLTRPVIALSPDGTHLAYVANKAGVQQIYLRAMDSFESKPISGTDGASGPFFSPDSQWIGFFADSKLKKVALAGGNPITLCATPGIHTGANWGTSDVIALHLTSGGLLQIPSAGGKPEPLTNLKNEASHRWPAFLPGGASIVFAATRHSTSNWTDSSVKLAILKTGEQRLISAGGSPAYSPTGHLLYTHEGTLLAVPFNLQSLTLSGPAASVLEGIAESVMSGVGQYSISSTGSLAYVAGGLQAIQQIMVWVDRKGNESTLAAPPRPYRNPRISPDGGRIVVGLDEPAGQVWIYDRKREALTRLTSEPDGAEVPTWTPDGQRVIFRAASTNLLWRAADASDRSTPLLADDGQKSPNSVSPDGHTLAFIKNDSVNSYDIWMLRMSDHKTEPFLRTPAGESAPMFSPDGHWLVYSSDETGHWEIYVQPFPGPGGRIQISTEGGMEPVWNRNGRELFYRNGDKMMVVDVGMQPQFTPGKPKVLFERPYVKTPATFQNYDVAPDGQHFLMLKTAAQEQSVTQINVVLNWFEDLKRRVSTSGK